MIIPRDKHHISRKEISENALKVLYRLNKAGLEAYLVGGSVRDLLLGKKPKDFDITTNATPDQMRKLFRNCRLVGRRFRLAHVMFGLEVIEVATFRGHHHFKALPKLTTTHINKSLTADNGMILRDNIFGSIEEDAQRRDFSVNSLYYSVVDFSLRDYSGGLKDLQSGMIRLIGEPETRYREDPVRMLRAVRFAAKLNMTISEETAEPIPRLADLLHDISPMRLFEESIKLFQTGYGESTYRLLCEYLLFQPLFPIISSNFTKRGDSYMEKMVVNVLKNTDYRMNNSMKVNDALLFSAMLWYPLLHDAKRLKKKENVSYLDAFSIAINNILNKQCLTLAIPRRLTTRMKDMWLLQLKLSKYKENRASKLVENPKFCAAYDLLVLRSEVEHNAELIHLTRWWRELQVSSLHKNKMLSTINNISVYP